MPALNLSRVELEQVRDDYTKRARKAKLPKYVTRYQRIADKARLVLEALDDPHRNHAKANSAPAHVRGQDGNGVAKIIHSLREKDVAVVQASRSIDNGLAGGLGAGWNVALLAAAHMLFPPGRAQELADAIATGFPAEAEQFQAEDDTARQGLTDAA